MSTPEFDPYLKWLAIRDPERPPNHYRLLGIESVETDPEVIQNAADARMAHLRTFQTGQHSELSQRLLNEIAIAKVCLLNPKRKAKYDAELHAAAPPAEAATESSSTSVSQAKPQAPSPSENRANAQEAPRRTPRPDELPSNRETVDASLEETLDLGSSDLFSGPLPSAEIDAFASPRHAEALSHGGSPVAALAPPDALTGLNSADPLAGFGAGMAAPGAGPVLIPVVARRKAPQTNPAVDWLTSTNGKLTLGIGLPAVLGLIVALALATSSKPRPTVVQSTSERTSIQPVTPPPGVGLDPKLMQPSEDETEWEPGRDGQRRRLFPRPGRGLSGGNKTEPEDPPAGPTEAETAALAAVEPWPQSVEPTTEVSSPSPEAGATFDLSHGALATAFLDQGRLVATIDWDGSIVVHDLKENREVENFGPQTRLTAAAFSPNGEAALLAGENGTLELWDVTLGERTREFDVRSVRGHPAHITAATFSPDGRHAATVGLDNLLRVWRLDRSTALDMIPTLDVHPRSVAWSPISRTVVVGADDGTLRVWNIDRRRTLLSVAAHRGPVRSLAFSPSGDVLLSGGDDGAIHIWQTRTSSREGDLASRSDSIRSLAFSPDGRWVLAAGGGVYRDGHWTPASDPSLQLFDLPARSARQTLIGHRATVTGVAFSSKNPPQAVSTGFDGMLRVWNLSGVEYGASVAPAVPSSDGPPAGNGSSDVAIAPLNAGLSPADLYPEYNLNPTGWLATIAAVVPDGPAADAASLPLPAPVEKYARTRALPAPRPLLTEEEWERYESRFAENVATVAKSGSVEETRSLAKELLSEAQLAAARDHGAQAFLTLRAFGLAAGRKGDLELAREAAAAFQDASPLAPPELRLPIDVVRVDLVRELQRLCKRLDKAAETQSTHPAAVKATLQLAETLRVYGLYDDARKALSDGAFYDSLRNLSEMDSNTKALRDLALDARRDVGKWAELRAHVQQAIETNSADDAAARTALGRVFIGSLANFDLAAPLLAEGNDPILTPLAKKYLECRTSPAAYLDLAKGCHTAAPPGSPESVQAVFATLGAEAAARYLDSGLTADAETQALARVLRDRAESLRPKFFPAEALSPPGDSRPPADLRDAVSLTGAELLLTSTPSGSPPPMPRSGRPR